MSEDRDLFRTESEEERKMRAKVHRWMGMSAALLTLVAIAVAVWRLNVSLEQSGLGISLGDSMRDMLGASFWVLVVVAVGVGFSLGTTRLMLGLEKLVRLVRGKRVEK